LVNETVETRGSQEHNPVFSQEQWLSTTNSVFTATVQNTSTQSNENPVSFIRDSRAGIRKLLFLPGMVVHAYNSRYSGGRRRRIASLRPTRQKLARPCLKNKLKAKGLGVGLKF
jgi:hypothetical protein